MPQLYEYDTETRTLTRVSRGETGTAEGDINPDSVVVSENGNAVYFKADGQLTANAPVIAVRGGNLENLYVYADGHTTYIATVERAPDEGEKGYATPDGEAFLFPSRGVVGKERGKGHDELYLYKTDGSLRCVSCGPGDSPVKGNASLPIPSGLPEDGDADLSPRFIPMTNDGRYIFFDTTAQLVPQDTNSTAEEGAEGGVPSGQDVYEWEEEGVGGCGESDGCVGLISSGRDDTAPSELLGASETGQDVFFATHAQLTPQNTGGMGDIYDARIDGGFAVPSTTQCTGEGCQGSPSGSPVLATPSSTAVFGDGNLAPPVPKPAVKAKPKPPTRAQKLAKALKACRKKRARQRSSCQAHARSLYGSSKKKG